MKTVIKPDLIASVPPVHAPGSGAAAIRRTLLTASATIALFTIGLTSPAPAVTIETHYIGGSFNSVPYYTCGRDWNCADPSARTTPVNPTPDWVIRNFSLAAATWARKFDDPWTVQVNYGFADVSSYCGGNPNCVVTEALYSPGRITSATVKFNSNADWFISPYPYFNGEFQPIKYTYTDLGGGKINTGLTLSAIPYGPDSVPTITCGADPCGAHQDFYTAALGAIAHALNLKTRTLAKLDPSAPSPVPTSYFGKIVIKDGRYAGSEVPWTENGGGHPYLQPGPATEPVGQPQTAPGDLVINSIYDYGAHRKLISDTDALIVAAVSDFKRVNLNAETIVTLPDFTNTTALASEYGKMTSLLTLNGAAALASQTNSSGATVTALRLTPDAEGQSGSAFLTKAFHTGANGSFKSEFGFKIGGVNGEGSMGADGFAFLVQADPRRAKALGGGGGDLGYASTIDTGVAGISHSLAVEFDTHWNAFDANENHIAFVLNGDMQSPLAMYAPSFALNDGAEHFAWVEYDGGMDMLSLFLSDTDTKPEVAALTAVLDLDMLLQYRDMYFGFTGATGVGFNYHDILEWNLDVVPEPDTILMLVPVLGGLVWLRRRSVRHPPRLG